MRALLLLALVSGAAFAQDGAAIYAPGVNASTSATALKFTAAAGSGANGFELTQGAKLTFDGATGAKYLSSDGSALVLTGLTYASGSAGGTNAVALTNGQRISLGSAYLYADGVSGGRVVVVGAEIVTGVLETQAHLTVGGRINNSSIALTVADNANPVTAATSTLTPGGSLIFVTCNDLNGCDITMGEGSATSGDLLRIVNASANAANFADTSGVSELSGSFAMGQFDALELMYVQDRWVETGRSNN